MTLWRWFVGGKAVERQAASTNQMGRFETELLATDANVEALADLSRHGQLTKTRLSDGCGGKTIKTAAQFGYDRHGFEGYLGYVG